MAEGEESNTGGRVSSILGRVGAGGRATGRGIVGAARAAAPVVGRSAGALGGAVGGVASGVGAAGAAGVGLAAGMGVINSFPNRGFILFVVSVIFFIVEQMFSIPVGYVAIITLFFLLYTSIFVFQKRGLVFVIAFVIWYIVFGAPGIESLRYYFLPIVLVTVVLHGLVNRLSKKESFVETTKEDIFYGGGAILIYLLDIGAVGLLKDIVTIPEIITYLMTNIPLFTYVGLFIMISENEQKTWLTGILGFLGIAYLVFIIISIPAVTGASDGDSLLPGPEQLIAARQEAEAKLPKTENPAWSNLMCMLDRPEDIAGCVQKRQEDSKIEAVCEDNQQVKDDIITLEECMTAERERIANEQVTVEGADDRTIKELTSAEFRISDYFPLESYRRAGEASTLKYPVEFELENPRKQRVEVEFSCYFNGTRRDRSSEEDGNRESESERRENFLGRATPQNAVFTDEKDARTVVCEPESDLDGTYTITYQAEIKGLNTKSRLTRVFIGTKTTAWKEEWVPKITSTYFQGNEHLSRAPNEFAKINFAFGNTLENPVVESSEVLFMAATVENNFGSGEILKVNHYLISLEGLDSYAEPENCLEGWDLQPQERDERVYLPTCTLSGLPPELDEDLGSENYVYKEFVAELDYNYLIKKEIRNVKVEEVQS